MKKLLILALAVLLLSLRGTAFLFEGGDRRAGPRAHPRAHTHAHAHSSAHAAGGDRGRRAGISGRHSFLR